MLTIWNFAHILAAAVYIAWWGLKVWMEKFAKLWCHTLEVCSMKKQSFMKWMLHTMCYHVEIPLLAGLREQLVQGILQPLSPLPKAQGVRLMEDNPLNNFLRTNSYFNKTEPNSRLLSEEAETELKPTIVVIFLRNYARKLIAWCHKRKLLMAFVWVMVVVFCMINTAKSLAILQPINNCKSNLDKRFNKC